MNKIIKTIYLFLFCFGFISCDIIEPPYTNEQIIDTNSNQVTQKVLVEYFTGHKCPNCPNEALVLKNLKNQYGDRLVLISVHSGPFATPSLPNYDVDYRTNEGSQLDAFFGVTAQSTPNALINRRSFEGNVVIPHASWTSAISENMMHMPVFSISITPNILGSNLSLNTNVKALSNIEGTFMVSTYIVEDSLISYQKNNKPEIGATPDIVDYPHRYVLRGSMNGAFGDTLFANQAMQNDSFLNVFTSVVSPEWSLEKLYLVCFVYNLETNEVIQSEIIKAQ